MEESFRLLYNAIGTLLDLFFNLFVILEFLIYSAAFGLDGTVIDYVTILVECVFAIEMILSNVHEKITVSRFFDWVLGRWLLLPSEGPQKDSHALSQVRLTLSYVFRSNFIFDLLSVIPFRLIVEPKIDTEDDNHLYLQLLHLLKLFRLQKIF